MAVEWTFSLDKVHLRDDFVVLNSGIQLMKRNETENE